MANNNNTKDIFSSQYNNVNTNHPLITNAQEYMTYNKYVSIHSEDRDLLKYPKSSEFEIELPEDYLNVSSIRLSQWTFPSNYNTFSSNNANTLLTFKINAPYNPVEQGVISVYYQQIYEALLANQNINYSFFIEDGFYTPSQMTTELTNKMNYTVTKTITEYFILQGWPLVDFNNNGGYTRFIVVYNSVSLKIWFGNTTDEFILTNEVNVNINMMSTNVCNTDKQVLPDASVWGLPGYLGLSRCNTESISSSSISTSTSTYNNIQVPRFYYGYVMPGDDGFWLLPNVDLTNSNVYWVEPTYKLNLMGDAFLYMELGGQNCIDETQPYNISNFTLTTNKTNGIVNSAFAKMAIPSTPLSQWFDKESLPYKYYYPPAERIRKIKVKIRYHNGQLADFGVFKYSFMLEFSLMVPQILRKMKNIAYPAPSSIY